MHDAKDYLILSNLKIHTELGELQKANLIVTDKTIHAILPQKEFDQFPNANIIEFPEDYHLVPGFIDLHVHGANGSDVMDANQEALINISQTLAKEGTTSFLATTMTAGEKDIEKALLSVREVMEKSENDLGAKLLGVHLEGPFLSPEKVGAQRADKIMAPNIAYIEKWQTQSNHAIKLITLAPELPNSLELIQFLKQKNIIASVGHTNATFSETCAAIDAGCSHVTHLFNAMRGIHQREPGVVTAALLSDQVYVELILDGIHLHPSIVQMILKLKGREKIILVTDAMRAKCLRDGVYDLGGQSVTVKHNIATLQDGTLAGSVLKMNSALKNILQFTNCDLSDAIKMTSENPARALGIFSQTGSIAINKTADLVVLDPDLNVQLTLCRGRIVYESQA